MKIFLYAAPAIALLSASPVLAQPPGGGPGGPRPGMGMPEHRTEVQQLVQDRFGAADANHDGFVSRDEMGGPGMRGGDNRFDRLDADKDGKLSVEELTRPALARFDRIDANHDGTIGPEEREAARAAMRARMQSRGADGPPPPPGDEPAPPR
jgi:hypothetical protein